jgi:hypothetical protein
MAQNQAESQLEADHQAKRPLLKNYQLIIYQIDQGKFQINKITKDNSEDTVYFQLKTLHKF